MSQTNELHECLGCGELVSSEQLWIHDKKHYYEILREFKIPPYDDPLFKHLDWLLK